MTYEWKKKPIEEALKGMKCVPHLKAAGFNTVGQLIDSTPEEIADAANFIGVKRASNIRNMALVDAVKDAERSNNAKHHVVDIVHEPLPLSFRIGLIVALVLSAISFCGFVLEVTQ